MSKVVTMIEALNKRLKEMERKARERNEQIASWSEGQILKAEYQAAARKFIKIHGFVDDVERQVMQRAAAERDAWRSLLAKKLADDEVTAKLFAQAIAELGGGASLGGLEEMQLEQRALKLAEIRAEVEHKCRADPEYRRLYEESARELGYTVDP